MIETLANAYILDITHNLLPKQPPLLSQSNLKGIPSAPGYSVSSPRLSANLYSRHLTKSIESGPLSSANQVFGALTLRHQSQHTSTYALSITPSAAPSCTPSTVPTYASIATPTTSKSEKTYKSQINDMLDEVARGGNENRILFNQLRDV